LESEQVILEEEPRKINVSNPGGHRPITSKSTIGGYIYGVDRAHRGMHGLELTEAERAIANLPQPHNSLLTP